MLWKTEKADMVQENLFGDTKERFHIRIKNNINDYIS